MRLRHLTTLLTLSLLPVLPLAPPATAAPLPATTAPTAAPATAPAALAPAVTAPLSYAAQLHALTNAERTKRGLRPLAGSTCAGGFANRQAVRLAAAGVLRHQALSPILTACHATVAGENLAYGNVTPARMMAMWMASPGHRANILSPKYNRLGVSAVRGAGGRVYAVQVFLKV